jgi:CRISPR/Cas system-associated protein endoribonuclease Cas2
MAELLVEIKKEFIEQLCNILSPLIYGGFETLYNHSKITVEKKNSGEKIFEVFQIYIKGIKTLTIESINNETERIKNNIPNNINIDNLIKAVMKSYIMCLLPGDNKYKINDNILNINLSEFIHNIYLESSNEFWNNPYLFYHQFPVLFF